ncbi:hypothetical protein ACOMHN_011017 [Nucella lapillus]
MNELIRLTETCSAGTIRLTETCSAGTIRLTETCSAVTIRLTETCSAVTVRLTETCSAVTVRLTETCSAVTVRLTETCSAVTVRLTETCSAVTIQLTETCSAVTDFLSRLPSGAFDMTQRGRVDCETRALLRVTFACQRLQIVNSGIVGEDDGIPDRALSGGDLGKMDARAARHLPGKQLVQHDKLVDDSVLAEGPTCSQGLCKQGAQPTRLGKKEWGNGGWVQDYEREKTKEATRRVECED